jgi:hypothetical protein
MNVAGTLLESVLPEPVDNIDNVLVIGVELAVGPAEFNQLLERRQVAGRATQLCGFLDRTRQIVELNQIARHVDRIGNHPPNFFLDDRLDLPFPVAQVGLSGRHHEFARRDLNRQDAKPCGVGTRHHFGDGSEVDLQGSMW